MILLQIDVAAKAAEVVQNVVPATVPKEMTLSLWELTVKGGIIMIPIAFLLILAVYIFIEKYIAIRKAAKEDTYLMNRIKELIHSGKIQDAITLCREKKGPVPRMLEKGLSRIGRPLNDINAAIENVGKQEIAILEKGLAVIATSAGGAPMLGFLGTVVGMVEAFYNMASVGGNTIDIQLLSNGIYTAMVTTVGGLIVGIIAYFAYNYLVAKIDNVVAMLENRITEFMDILNEPV